MAFLAFLGLNILAAASGGILSPGQWYEELRKPVWQPPKWAFPLVWMILYFLTAWAGWMIWVSSGFDEARTWALVVYGISLVLNAGWSWIFFGLRKVKLALVEAILLWLSVAGQLVLFWQIEPMAGMILVPYLIWVSVAVLLNKTLIDLNPEKAYGGA